MGAYVSRLAFWVVAACVPAVICGTARADTPIKIGTGYGTTCAIGGCLLPGINEADKLGIGEFSLYLNSNNAAALNTTTLVILGVPVNYPLLPTGVLSTPAASVPDHDKHNVLAGHGMPAPQTTALPTPHGTTGLGRGSVACAPPLDWHRADNEQLTSGTCIHCSA